MTPKLSFGGPFPLLLLAVGLLLLCSAVTGKEIVWPEPDDRFPVYEACRFKYGFLPQDPEDKTPRPQPPPGYMEHNVALEECERTYYRQQFCRNQLMELRGQNYQRICKHFNPHDLKFFGAIFGVIGTGAFLRTIMRMLKIPLPYTVLLMLIGMGLGGLSNISGICTIWTTFTKVARTPPGVILNVFLPVLIFESSFNMKSHLFFKSIFSILILALPGMLFSTFLTALLCQHFFISYEWGFIEACLFGSIISATDPVAVVSILKEVGTSETLGILVDGESLLNDGVAILLFEIFSEINDQADLQIKMETEENLGVKIFLQFAQITLGGPLWGWFMAKLSIFYLSLIFNDAAVEVSVTLCAAFLTYYIGETFLHVSGVMALVLLGITLSGERTCISPEVQGLVHHFWEMLGYLANTVLFVVLGIVITETAVNSFKPEDGYYLVFLYFGLNIIRLAMIGVMSPVLSRIGYGLSWQNMLVMTWGGLRGAVGVCLSLQVYKDKVTCHRENVGPKILLQTAGIVLLTLLVNGSTTKTLLDMLKLTRLSIGKIQDMNNAVRQIRSAQQKALRIFRHDRFLADANWSIVEDSTSIVNPYLERHVQAKEEAAEEKKKPTSTADPDAPVANSPETDTQAESEAPGDQMQEMTEEARLRLIKALKVSCWRQYEQGVLADKALHILDDALEKLEDKKFEMLNHKEFQKYWDVRGIFVALRQRLLKYSDGLMDEEIAIPKQPWRLKFYRITMSLTFSVLIYVIILTNISLTIWESVYIAENDLTRGELIMFYTINLAFTLIYLAEFGIKVSGVGFGEYMNDKWNLMDLVILIMGMIEIILSGTYLPDELHHAKDSGNARRSSQEGDFLKFVRFIRILRVLRILRFFKPMLPMLMRFMNNRLNDQLFLGYDLGKGFVTAVDDVQKFLPQIIEEPKILLKFKTALETQRIEVIRSMGLLQKEHPGIAIAVKSRHASRAVLNHMKDSLNEMKEDGLIDDQEYVSLIEELEQKMKNLWASPSYMKPTSAELALANVPWMIVSSGGKELFEFVYKQATLLQYQKKDIICSAGDPANGIYLIVDGLIRAQYESTFELSVEREEYGIIPNMELFQDLSFENEMEDYFSTGTVIGEIGVLTDRPRAATVTCETSVTAYHIPQSVLKTAIESFQDPYDSLEARMWRVVGIKIATSLLPNEAQFASWTLERVKAYVERSAVPMQSRDGDLVIPEFVSDVVVIYGQFCNAANTNEVYTAPCLLPRYVTHLTKKPGSSVTPLVLIIAEEDTDQFDDEDESNVQDTGRSPSGAVAGQTGDGSSMRHIIQAGIRGHSLTEEDVISIQLQRQSRTVSFGVATSKSKSKAPSDGVSAKTKTTV